MSLISDHSLDKLSLQGVSFSMLFSSLRILLYSFQDFHQHQRSCRISTLASFQVFLLVVCRCSPRQTHDFPSTQVQDHALDRHGFTQSMFHRGFPTFELACLMIRWALVLLQLKLQMR